MFVATLVGPPEAGVVNDMALKLARLGLKEAGAVVTGQTHLDGADAVDLAFDGVGPQAARQALLRSLNPFAIDVIVQRVADRRKRLFIADMDSTMITVECIDELADFVGKKAEVSAVTEAAMRGELDFESALDARVALLQGLPLSALQRCYDERVAPNMTSGAKTLIQTLNAHGCHTVLVSGGFTFFTGRVRSHLGFAFDRSNVLLENVHGLTGAVEKPIINAAVKREELLAQAARLGLSMRACVAIGDGANDIPMIETAGLGLAFRAKPKTEAAADAAIRHADLTAVLYAMGLAKADWIS
jgi:phosphoserine phosphatase